MGKNLKDEIHQWLSEHHSGSFNSVAQSNPVSHAEEITTKVTKEALDEALKLIGSLEKAVKHLAEKIPD